MDDYTQDYLEFELDFCIACNMMLGMTYEQAQEEARQWVADAEEAQRTDS